MPLVSRIVDVCSAIVAPNVRWHAATRAVRFAGFMPVCKPVLLPLFCSWRDALSLFVLAAALCPDVG